MTDTHYHYRDFPFEEKLREDGDQFNSVAEAITAGYLERQIWSVSHTDEDENDVQTDTYGPPYHYVNVMGYVATEEFHDNNTYYIEEYKMDDFTTYEPHII